jgi:hypothetical protein
LVNRKKACLEILEVFGLFYKRAGFYLKVFVYGGGVVWKNNKRGGFI